MQFKKLFRKVSKAIYPSSILNKYGVRFMLSPRVSRLEIRIPIEMKGYLISHQAQLILEDNPNHSFADILIQCYEDCINQEFDEISKS